MHHHRRADVVEYSAFEHEDLAATGFLGGRTDHADGDAEFVRERGQTDARADRGRSNDVVPARVSDAGQRVVLGAEREHQVTAAEPGIEGGRQVGDAGAHLETAAAQHVDDLRGAAVLLEGEFRFGVNRMRQRDQGV